MPYNYVLLSGLADISAEKKQKMFDAGKSKLEVINEYVKSKKEGKLERDSELILFLIDLFGLRKWMLGFSHKYAGFLKPADIPFSEILPLMDKNFCYDEKCNGCGICSKVCPVNNMAHWESPWCLPNCRTNCQFVLHAAAKCGVYHGKSQRANNITMDHGKPLWQHHCEQCFACLQWCPKEAIQFGNETKNGKRYHHPDVKLSHTIDQAKK